MPRHGGAGGEQLLGREGHGEEKQRGGQKCGPVRKEVVAGGRGRGAKKGHMLKIWGSQRAGPL